MIDDDGYRPNVGIVICNRQGQVMWARRFGQHSWQFPQGGINPGESAEQAMFGALGHEAGLYRPKTKMVSLAAGERRCRNQYANQQYTRV